MRPQHRPEQRRPAPRRPEQRRSEPRRLVVVGAGMAATRLVEELVTAGSAHTITVLGDEPAAPYNRILLSAVLEGTHRPDALTLRAPGWFAEHGVDLRLGARVLGVDTTRRDVMLVDGTVICYDDLVLATGSIPTLPPIRGLVRMDGSLHPAVHAFRSRADCDRLLAALAPEGGPRPQRAVVVGGGLLGLQVARALSIRGLATEIVEGADHLLRSQVDPGAGRLLARDLRRLGTQVYTGARVVRLCNLDAQTAQLRRMNPHPSAVGLRLDNGVTLDADLVVLTAGGRPSTALARGAGLQVRRGIVVDDRLRTSAADVYAIGDCAQHDGRVTGFVPPAWDQARVLADVLAGGDGRYDGSRSVARLRATDLDVAVLGDVDAAIADGGRVVEMSNPLAGSHRRLVVKDGRITAAALVGDLARVGLITQHFDRGTVLGPAEPGELLLAERTAPGVQLPDDAEICTCAGVTAGAIRACSSLEQARMTTRATTGCGGCADVVRSLLAGNARPAAATKGT